MNLSGSNESAEALWRQRLLKHPLNCCDSGCCESSGGFLLFRGLHHTETLLVGSLRFLSSNSNTLSVLLSEQLKELKAGGDGVCGLTRT